MVRQRARIRFGKQGDLRLAGHRDMARALERLFRRAGLRLGMSQGFHPKPRISFPSALALGMEGSREVMELELAETCSAEELLERLAAHSLPGLVFHSVEILPEGVQKARHCASRYAIALPAEAQDSTRARIGQLLAAPSWPVARGEESALDVRPFVDELRVEDGELRMRLRVSRQRSASPRDLLSALGLEDLERQGIPLTRTDVELEP